MQLITEAYRQLNRQMHKLVPEYGRSGAKNADNVLKICRQIGAKSVLDYGCGKQELAKAVSHLIQITGYDPAIPGLDEAVSADLVVCADVMEHVEPEFIDNVLSHIFALSGLAAYFVISTVPGARRLPDGTLAHRSVHDGGWWESKLSAFGTVKLLGAVHHSNPEAVFLVTKYA